VALLAEDSGGDSPGTREVAVAMLALLRRLAEAHPLLVAVDDVQWLDGPSASVIDYGLRRLGIERIALLATASPGSGFSTDGLRRAVVGPLDSRALIRVLRDALTPLPPRSLLRRVEAISGGNPFYALEIGRALERSGTSVDPSAPLPLPGDLRALIRDRLGALPAASRDALRAAAALAHPTWSQVGRAVAGGDKGLRAAWEAEIVEIDGDSIRFAHPLLASVVYADADPGERREIHRRLAEIVTDAEERARHVALAVEAPDARVAAVLEEAARRASERGAIDGAADLGEQSLRFTPEGFSEDAQRRLLSTVGYLARAGSKARARELVGAAYSTTPRGSERARITLTAARLGLWNSAVSIERLREAIEAAGGDTPLLADLHAVVSHKLLYHPDLAAAAHHAQLAVDLAEQLGDDARLAVALVEASWVALFTGKGLDQERVGRALALEAHAGKAFGTVGVARGFLAFALGATDQLDASRRAFEARVAEERNSGDTGVMWSLQELARVEIRAGNWERAQALAEESLEIGLETEEPFQVLAYRPLMRLAALRGEAETARELAAAGLRLAAQAESPGTRADLMTSLGLLELS